MRTGVYNYTESRNYKPAMGYPFDRDGYTLTFPGGSCQYFNSSSHGGGGIFVPTVSPTYYWYTSSPSQRWTSNWYPTSQPSYWYYTSRPNFSPTRFPTPTYYTSSPIRSPTRVPTPTFYTYSPIRSPTRFPTPVYTYSPIRYPYPTPNYGGSVTSSPTWSPTFEYFFGFESIAASVGARPLEIVSRCDDCTEDTRFRSFPYSFRGRDNIWTIVVSSNGYLELVGDCAPSGFATCAVINVVTTADLDPSASTIGDRIWSKETEESYIYSFEYVPIKSISSPFEVEEDDASWMIDDDAILNRYLQDVTPQGNVSAQVHLYFDGRIDICWGDIFMTEFNHSFTSSIEDFVGDITIPANGYHFDETGTVLPYRYPSYTCQTLLRKLKAWILLFSCTSSNNSLPLPPVRIRNESFAHTN